MEKNTNRKKREGDGYNVSLWLVAIKETKFIVKVEFRYRDREKGEKGEIVSSAEIKGTRDPSARRKR